METAKLFKNGQSQAVRLPKNCRFEGDRVFVKRVGNGVLLLPYREPWDTLFESLDDFSQDFLADGREQQDNQERPAFD